jgi:hypothetical protein
MTAPAWSPVYSSLPVINIFIMPGRSVLETAYQYINNKVIFKVIAGTAPLLRVL